MPKGQLVLRIILFNKKQTAAQRSDTVSLLWDVSVHQLAPSQNNRSAWNKNKTRYVLVVAGVRVTGLQKTASADWQDVTSAPKSRQSCECAAFRGGWACRRARSPRLIIFRVFNLPALPWEQLRGVYIAAGARRWGTYGTLKCNSVIKVAPVAACKATAAKLEDRRESCTAAITQRKAGQWSWELRWSSVQEGGTPILWPMRSEIAAWNYSDGILLCSERKCWQSGRFSDWRGAKPCCRSRASRDWWEQPNSRDSSLADAVGSLQTEISVRSLTSERTLRRVNQPCKSIAWGTRLFYSYGPTCHNKLIVKNQPFFFSIL